MNPLLVAGLVVGLVIVLLVVALGAVTLVGRQAPIREVSSAPTVLPSSPSSLAPAVPGAPKPAVPGAPSGPGTGGIVNPACAAVPPIVATDGPADPDQLVNANFNGTIDTAAVVKAYGPLNLDRVDRWDTIGSFINYLKTIDNAARQARLELDGFRTAAKQEWTAGQGDEISLLTVALADKASAVDYANFHLSQVCGDAMAVARSQTFPGGVTMLIADGNGRPGLYVFAVAGNTELTLRICTCHPGDLSRQTAEEWAARIIGQTATKQT